MTRIVTTHFRYKRPPRKRKAVAIEGPAVVTTTSRKQPRDRRLRRDTRHVTVLAAVLRGVPEATQLRHHDFAQPAAAGVVASRLVPDHVNRHRR